MEPPRSAESACVQPFPLDRPGVWGDADADDGRGSNPGLTNNIYPLRAPHVAGQLGEHLRWGGVVWYDHLVLRPVGERGD
jgi:hypothetical protein